MVRVCRIFTNIVEKILYTPEIWNTVNNITPGVSRGNSINRNFDLNPSSYIEANAQYCSCIVVTESTGWHKPYFASPHSLYILLWFSPHHPPLLVVLLYLILRISITINSICTCTSLNTSFCHFHIQYIVYISYISLYFYNL